MLELAQESWMQETIDPVPAHFHCNFWLQESVVEVVFAFAVAKRVRRQFIVSPNVEAIIIQMLILFKLLQVKLFIFFSRSLFCRFVARGFCIGIARDY